MPRRNGKPHPIIACLRDYPHIELLSRNAKHLTGTRNGLRHHHLEQVKELCVKLCIQQGNKQQGKSAMIAYAAILSFVPRKWLLSTAELLHLKSFYWQLSWPQASLGPLHWRIPSIYPLLLTGVYEFLRIGNVGWLSICHAHYRPLYEIFPSDTNQEHVKNDNGALFHSRALQWPIAKNIFWDMPRTLKNHQKNVRKSHLVYVYGATYIFFHSVVFLGIKQNFPWVFLVEAFFIHALFIRIADLSSHVCWLPSLKQIYREWQTGCFSCFFSFPVSWCSHLFWVYVLLLLNTTLYR